MNDVAEVTQDEALAAEARANLEAAGCTGIRLQGGGDQWWVWALLASRDGVLHEACAFSARNPATPNDPVYLAGSLLTTLRKNVWAHERGMGLDKPQPAEETAPVEATIPVVPEPPAQEPPAQEPDMAQPININVAPVFNVGGSHSESGAKLDAERAALAINEDGSDVALPNPVSDVERAAIAEVEQMFDPGPQQEEAAQDETHGETGAERAAGDAGSKDLVRGIFSTVSDEAAPAGSDDVFDGDGSDGASAERDGVSADTFANEGLGALDETPLPESEATDQPAEEIADSLSLGDDATTAEGAEDLGSADDGSASGGGALFAHDGSAQSGDSDFDYALDADFAEVGAELSEEDAAQLNTDFVRDPLLIEGAEIGLDVAATPDEPTAGPIAYAASDLDALIREKLGRVSQIARELKAALQEGWTLEEFASLQNLIVRIDRKEAPDDEPARARFQAISERSQAMSRVDGHRDALEAALEDIGKSRDYAAAVEFDPDARWPYFG